MADLTLNFTDASFDINSDNDFEISSGNDFIYETAAPGNKIDTGITTGAAVTGAAFTVAHNQDFMFEFEDDGVNSPDYEVEIHTQVTPPTQGTYGVPGTPGVMTVDSITFDVGAADVDGVAGRDTTGALVNGDNMKVEVTRLADPMNPYATDTTETVYVGDGEVANYTSWVMSGDMNGTTGNDTTGDGSLGFKAGHYGGVFLGGDGTDTLVFEHNNAGDTAQMYVGLDSGFAMFGNGANSPLVQFADIGASPYELTWERLEMRGDSNDFVVVGGGLQGTDLSTAAKALDTSNFFQIDLGSGNDTLHVTDAKQSITLDLSKTGNHTVNAYDSGDVFNLDVSGNETDGMSPYSGDPFTLKATGEFVTTDASGNPVEPKEGVIDYIDFGDGQNNKVTNTSELGLAVNFGTAHSTAMGQDEFIGSDLTESDLIDLRGIDAELQIFDENADASGSIIHIDASGTDIDIQATNVDLLYVSQLNSGVADASDSDVLVNAEDLYGSTGVLGKTLHDVNGDGYDVITSARLESWSTDGVKQIYYDGDHSDFLDTDDTLDRDASGYDVAMKSVSTTSEQLQWNDQIEAAQAASLTTEGSATPSFYIIDNLSGKKVPVYLDETDPAAPQWKVDTSEFEVTSDAGMSFMGGGASLSEIATKIKDDYGYHVDTMDLGSAKSVYLNGSQDDVASLLKLSNGSTLDSMEMDAAYDFGFYTQVEGTKTLPGGGTEKVMINVALDHNYDIGTSTDSWAFSSDPSVHVQTSYNTVQTAHNAAVGGTGGDFVEMGGGTDNVAMGNAGSDAYIVDASDNGVINELGSLMGGGSSDADSVQFELVNDMAELDFSRIQIAGEKAGNTLQITASNGNGEATLFDQYNDFLEFRKTEYLVIDDGATANEVFELVTDDAMADASGNEWDNEVYVANAGGDSITVNAGGEDHVFLGSGADTVNLGSDLGSGGSVTVHNLGAGDKVMFQGADRAEATADSIEVTQIAGGHRIEYYDATGAELEALQVELFAAT